MDRHRHTTIAGLEAHQQELVEFLAVLERIGSATFPPHEWAFGDDRDAAEIYVGDMRGAVVGSPEDVRPSALDRLRDALLVSRGEEAAREAVRRLRRPVEAFTTVGSGLVALAGCATRSAWDAVTTRARQDAALADRISKLEIEWSLACREVLRGASFATALLASVPDPGSGGGVRGPRRARQVRVLVDGSSFRSPTGTPRDTGRVRIRVEAPGVAPTDAQLSRNHYAVLSSLKGPPKRITVKVGRCHRSTARACEKRLKGLGLAVSRPAAGRPTEIESADDIQLVEVQTLLSPERGMRRFSDASRGQEMCGEL